MRVGAVIVIILLLNLCAVSVRTYGAELESRYATITYDNEGFLKEFNSGVRLRGLSYLMKKGGSMTVADEVKNKVDVVAEKVQMVLEMFPKQFKFKVVLLASAREVRKIYKSKYGRDVDFISFYSPGDKAVYISTDDVELRVFGHEVAHAVIDQYFKVGPSVRIHEVLAKYAESHLTD